MAAFTPEPAIIVIPARMESTRLPGKPLADICGLPMIVHVMNRALEANIGPVIIATDSEEIAAAVRAHGGEAILTSRHHPSGSDRIFEAIQAFDKAGRFDCIVNVQGDLPTIAGGDIQAALAALRAGDAEIATLAAEIHDPAERTNPNVVKVVGSEIGERRLRALYFTRTTAPYGEGPLFHHIGLYAYRRAALARFIALPPSKLELREKLEQLRALEAGMRIDVAIVDSVPLGVDTPDDLALARARLG